MKDRQRTRVLEDGSHEFIAEDITTLCEDYLTELKIGSANYEQGKKVVDLRIAYSSGTTHAYDEVVRLQEVVKHQAIAIQLNNTLIKRLMQLLSRSHIPGANR